MTSADRATDPEILRELVTLHAAVLLRMPAVAVLVSLAMAWENARYVPWTTPVAWGAGLVGIESVRALYAWRLRARGGLAGDDDARRVHRTLVLLAGLAGLAVGVSGALFFPYVPDENRVLIALVYFAMTAGGIAVSASSQAILSAYSLAMLLPAAVAWAWVVPAQSVAVIGLALLYCTFLILVAGDGERLLARSIRIRQERDRVVLDLQRRNADVQAAMAEAERSAQARARVLAAASHDLRQPLHALSIYSAILNAKPDADALAEVSRNVDQLVRALGNLLNGLLDLSRLSSGHFVPERKVFALDRIAHDVGTEMAGAAQAKGLALVERLEPVKVEGDPTAIGRVLRNLIDNAIKYTDRGTITVAVYRDGARACLSVTDTGKGIPASEHGRIFEEFYQLDNAARDRSKGVGLGLAIVQRLCELVGATITVDSAPGRGARFVVSMPAHAALDAVASTDAAPLTARALRGQRVVVVDDEPEIQRSMSQLLSLWGLRVRTAGSPDEVRALIAAEGAPDLLLADLRLGGDEHGAALAQRLRDDHPRMAVLILTGETSSDALRDANRGGLPLLQKPVTAEVLYAAVADALAPARPLSGA